MQYKDIKFASYPEALAGINYYAFVWEFAREAFALSRGWDVLPYLSKLKCQFDASPTQPVVPLIITSSRGIVLTVHQGLFTRDFPEKSIVELSDKSLQQLKGAARLLEEANETKAVEVVSSLDENDKGVRIWRSSDLEHVTLQINWCAPKCEILKEFKAFVDAHYWSHNGKRQERGKKSGAGRIGGARDYMTSLQQLRAYRLMKRATIEEIIDSGNGPYKDGGDYSHANRKVKHVLQTEFGVGV